MANSILVLAGRKANLFERGIVSSSSENALFPRSQLWDGRPSRPFRFGAAAANDQVTLDTCLTLDPGFESWVDATTPEKWTASKTGGAAVDRVTTPVDSGTYAVKLSSPGVNPGNAQVEQVIEVRSGDACYAWARARVDSPAGEFIHLYAQNRQTKRWLQPDGTWSASELPWASVALSTSYQSITKAFAVESMDVCLVDLVQLRLIAKYVGPAYDGGIYLDNYRVLPEINFASVHGHNIDAGVVVELRSSNDSTFATSTLRATMTKRVPTFFTQLAAPISTDQYWRSLFSGTNIEPISLGELVLGRALTLARRPDYGWEIKPIEADVATETPTGEVYSYAQAKWARRVLGMQFKFFSAADMEEQLREVFTRCRGRRHPLVVVPDESLPWVLHGRIDRSWAAKRRLVNAYDDTSLVVSESPFEVATL